MHFNTYEISMLLTIAVGHAAVVTLLLLLVEACESL
jgi:hypothetical protein